MLDHSITWAQNVPKVPPQHFQYWVGNRRDNWERLTDALWLVSQGFAVGREIQHLLARRYHIQPDSGSLSRLLPKMVSMGLLRQSMPRISQHRRARLVALDCLGHVIAKDLGWQPGENEWERLQRLHEHGKQKEQRHTVSVLWFTWHARLRGLRAGVVPDVPDAKRFAPDVLLEQAGRSIYVEVERGTPDLAKWRNMLDYQGFIAFCARNPSHRQKLKETIQENFSIGGFATDIKTLLDETWQEDGEIGPLWAEVWQ